MTSHQSKFGYRVGSLISGNFLPADVRTYLTKMLPQELRQHSNAVEFIKRVDEAAQNASENAKRVTPGQTKSDIEALSTAATRLCKALKPFTGASESFDTLQAHFDYQHPSPAPLSELLTRLSADLLALREGCTYAVDRIKPNAAVQPQKDAARWMVEIIIRAHVDLFGKKPPMRGWFEDFVKAAGDAASVPCGTGVIDEAVSRFNT